MIRQNKPAPLTPKQENEILIRRTQELFYAEMKIHSQKRRIELLSQDMLGLKVKNETLERVIEELTKKKKGRK